MSFKAAILMEDHLNDQYILKPLIESMLASIGKPNSKVTVVTSPRIQGIDQLKRNLCGIVNTFAAKVDLMVIAFDQDGQDGANGGKSRNTQVEDWLSQCANSKVQLLCAIQEVEVWCLWGNRKDLGVPWSTVRSERDPKERFFDSLTTREDRLRPDKGRSRLITASLSGGFDSIAQGCSELADLRQRVKQMIDAK
ncbi:hypothetical protein F4553_003060 [Allocatelliglobosispora scoriae]|uniref:DUF4276 family protein n=1 Tax=Allocatelliglobosispora scoriae TaxID=643052 RepID=A0A841BS92_9ACTN|nr:hypothetical protein [Allocatelliglobosispora scoriae]MBB5869681.1 hypothetical protein [Allocatelliglobosispora scoriae]